jgi:hypothetical protein
MGEDPFCDIYLGHIVAAECLCACNGMCCEGESELTVCGWSVHGVCD